MARRLLLVAAVSVFLGAAILAISLPSRLTCASLGYPEGTRCKEGRIDFEDHGRFVSVHLDRRSGPRLAILGSGAIVATVLLLMRDRQKQQQPLGGSQPGTGFGAQAVSDEGANVAPIGSGGAGL